MQTSLQQLLQGIQPGLTLYGVLLTFALVSFAVSRHFWRYERELIAENIERLRALLQGFRQQHIEPIISNQLANATSGAYEIAIVGLIDDLYPKTQGEKGELRRELVSDDLVKEIISESAFHERLSSLKQTGRVGEDFLASSSGKALLDGLDRLYEQKGVLAGHYTRARQWCARTCYGSLVLCVLALIGILNLVASWPRLLIDFWLLFALQAAVYTVYSFTRLEHHRHALFRMWEKFQLYGDL